MFSGYSYLKCNISHIECMAYSCRPVHHIQWIYIIAVWELDIIQLQVTTVYYVPVFPQRQSNKQRTLHGCDIQRWHQHSDATFCETESLFHEAHCEMVTDRGCGFVLAGRLRWAIGVQRTGLRRGLMGQRLRWRKVSWSLHSCVQIPPLDRSNHLWVISSLFRIPVELKSKM